MSWRPPPGARPSPAPGPLPRKPDEPQGRGFMPPVILAVDQGSSSSRCVAFDARLEPVAVASRPVTTAFPAPGRVEHDAGEIADGVLGCLGAALAPAGADSPDVAGIGLAAQTQKFSVCDRATRQT